MASIDIYPEGRLNDPAIPGGRVPIFRRISWGSIFAGVVVALIFQFLLGLLGVAVGAGAIDPYGNGPSLTGISIGAGIWLVISALIGLFIGGWVAGWLSGLPRGIGTVLHGIVTWGLATFLLFFILTTAVGAIISGAFNVLGAGLSVVGRGASSAVSAATGNTAIDSMASDMLASLGGGDQNNTGATRRGGTLENRMQNETSRPALERDTAFTAVISRAIAAGKDSLDQNDRNELVNVLVTHQNMSRDQAENTVDKVNQNYQNSKQQISQLAEQAKEKARDVANVAASGVSQAATWSFIMVALGGVAAALGGLASRRK